MFTKLEEDGQSDQPTGWLQVIWHVTCEHALGDTLRNGALSETRVAKQDKTGSFLAHRLKI